MLAAVSTFRFLALGGTSGVGQLGGLSLGPPAGPAVLGRLLASATLRRALSTLCRWLGSAPGATGKASGFSDRPVLLFAMMIHHVAGQASRLNESSHPLPRCLRPRLHAASRSPSLRHAGPVRAADKVFVKLRPAGVQQQWIRQNLRTKPCK